MLTLIGELLTGETLITPGGPVDYLTAVDEEPYFWGAPPYPQEDAPVDSTAAPERELVTVG